MRDIGDAQAELEEALHPQGLRQARLRPQAIKTSTLGARRSSVSRRLPYSPSRLLIFAKGRPNPPRSVSRSRFPKSRNSVPAAAWLFHRMGAGWPSVRSAPMADA